MNAIGNGVYVVGGGKPKPKVETKKKKEEAEPPKCIVCLDAPRNCCLDPCGHANLCVGCAEQLETCPTCRADIEQHIRIFS
jgi:hypothetical protein